MDGAVPQRLRVGKRLLVTLAQLAIRSQRRGDRALAIPGLERGELAVNRLRPLLETRTRRADRLALTNVLSRALGGLEGLTRVTDPAISLIDERRVAGQQEATLIVCDALGVE